MPIEASLVLALHDRVLGLAGFRIVPQLLAVGAEGVRQRGGRRDRIPGADGGAAIDRAERGGVVALDEDAVADLVGLLDPEPDRAFQVLQRPVAAEMQRMDVGGEELLLALVLFADQLLDQLRVEIEQRAERAEIDDVLEQLPLARIGVGRIGDRGQGDADHGDVGAEFRRRHRLGGNRRTDSRRARSRRRPCPRSAGSSPPSCRRRRGHRDGRLRSPAPRTRSAVPGCWRGRCCAATPARRGAGSHARTIRWRSPSPNR